MPRERQKSWLATALRRTRTAVLAAVLRCFSLFLVRETGPPLARAGEGKRDQDQPIETSRFQFWKQRIPEGARRSAAPRASARSAAASKSIAEYRMIVIIS
jgi:hypothetical protein